MGGDRRGGGRGGEGEWRRRGRSEGGIGKQERGRDGDQKGRRGRKRVEERVGRQEGGGGGGRAEEGDGRERVRGNENNTVSCIAVLLTKVVVASPPSPTMSPPSLDCCVVWRWEINEERIIMLK